MVLPKFASGKPLNKIITLVLLQAFILSSVAFGSMPQDTPQKDISKQEAVIVDPDKIIVQRDFGLVKSRYTGKNKKLVVHIQDAHCNFEAQSNIIKILEGLIKNDGLALVSVEGADGFIDTSWFKAFPDEEVRKEVATYFMKKGEITGPEFLSITTDYPIKLFGAETRAYYIQNLNAFTSSYPLKEDTERYYNQIRTLLNKLKNYIYSDELKELDVKIQDYEAKKIQFTDYVKYLESEAGKHQIKLREYQNLFKLVSVLVYEKKINFDLVDKERTQVIDALTKKLDKDALTELVNQSLSFKAGKISSAEYYQYLKAAASKYGIVLIDEYPNLFNYIIYNSVYSRIENEKLFKDIKDVERAIKEKLFANDEQRTLDKLSYHIEILLGLVNIKLLNGDFDYYKANQDGFSYEIFAAFINKMSARYGFAYEVEPPYEAVKESMPKLVDFYEIAIKRDKALVDNTLQAMKKEDAQISVLVTGGFHSEGITKLLENQGISYVVVCPNITKEVETPYIKILTNQRTPLEEILSDTGATTADAKNVKSGMLAAISRAMIVPLESEELGALFAGMGVKAKLIKDIIEKAREIKGDWRLLGIQKWMERMIIEERNDPVLHDADAMKSKYIKAVEESLKKIALSQNKPKTEGAKPELTLRQRLYIGRLVKKVTGPRSGFSEAFSEVHVRLFKAPSNDEAGAIRLKGGVITDHGTRLKGHSIYAKRRLELAQKEKSLNGALARPLSEGNAFAVTKNNVKLPLSDTSINLTKNRSAKMKLLQERLAPLGINFIVVKGFKEELRKAGLEHLTDVIFHYGVTRQAVYIDEEDFNYLFSLQDGVDIIVEGAAHERAHINNELANLEDPTVKLLTEGEIDEITPSANVRKAVFERTMSNIERDMKSNAMPDLPEDAVQLPRGSYGTKWWEEAAMAKLALDPTPWGDDHIVPIEEDGVIKVRITKEMLEKYITQKIVEEMNRKIEAYKRERPGEKLPDELRELNVNLDGRNILESFAKYAELGPKSIAGIRHTMNISNIHDTRQVKNSFERLLTTISVALMIKITYNKGAYFPYQANYGHEVRYHSNEFQDETLRILAAMGFICHTVPDNVPTAIWNTSTSGKFFDMILSFCGTASHSESEIDGLKIMDYEGSQFLIDNIEAMIAIQKAIIATIQENGFFEFTLSAKDDPRITDALYRLTHNGMFVYKKYQDKTTADKFVLDLVGSVDPSKLHIDCAHGSGYRTLTAFFKEMGLTGVTSKIDWMHTEERPDFGNIGKCLENPRTGKKEIFDYGADVTQVYEKKLPSGKIIKYFPVLCTADYPQRFAAMPIGDIILHTDMDNDRLAASQILPNNAEMRGLLDDLGVVYNVINSEKILAVFIPNKFFHFLHEMNFERLTALMREGKVDKDRKIVVLKTLASTPAVDTWAKRRQEEGYKVEVINTGVGFSKLANAMYRTEGEMKRAQGKDIIITDASGKDINIGPNPIILTAWEESGGIITGITYGFSDILGNPFLAEREKSATESIFLSLALISKLQHSKAGQDLAAYLKMLYDRDNVDTPIDIRFDNKLFTPGASEEAKRAEKEGNARRDRIFGAHLALVMAYMTKEISIEEARVILRDIFDQEYEARRAQGQMDQAFLERYKQIGIDSLKDIWFTGDGVMFVFEKAGKSWLVLFRPSGTEPKLKSYGFGKDTARLTIDTWTFAFTENTAGSLPESFTSNKALMKYWGDTGTKAVDRAQRMQSAWEVYGLVVDTEDTEDLARLGIDRAGLEKRKLARSFTPPDDHLQIIQKWLKDEGLGELNIDLTQPPAMPQKDIVALLEAIPEDVYKKLGRTKDEVLAKESKMAAAAAAAPAITISTPAGYAADEEVQAQMPAIISTMATQTGTWATEQFTDAGKRMLGWMRLGAWRETPQIAQMVEEMQTFAAYLEGRKKSGDITDVVFVGQGGSVECIKTFLAIFGRSPNAPNIHIVDSTDQEFIANLKDKELNYEKTHFVVLSKSLTTQEVHSVYKLFFDECINKGMRREDAQQRFTLVTDVGKASYDKAAKYFTVAAAVKAKDERSARIAKELEERGFGRVFYIEPGSGGRYSWDTAVGILPAMIMGQNIKSILKGAETIEALAQNPDLGKNPMAQYGVFKYMMQRAGRNRPTLILPEELKGYGPWYGQLDTESLGKTNELSSIVIDHESLAENPAEYTKKRFFVRIKLGENDNRFDEEAAKLEAVGLKVFTITLPNSTVNNVNAQDFGALLKLSEFATAIAGYLMGINPVNQPGVEAYKKAQDRYLKEGPTAENPQYVVEEGNIKLNYEAAVGSNGVSEQRVNELLQQIGNNTPAARYAALLYLAAKEKGRDYAVMMIFKKLTLHGKQLTGAMDAWRYKVRNALRIDTLSEEAPCILHAKQQGFQQGENSGFFTIVRFANYGGEESRIVIPGSREAYGTERTFEDLIKAQAAGTLAALSEAGRLGVMLELRNSSKETIEEFGDFVEKAAGFLGELSKPAARIAVAPEEQAPVVVEPKTFDHTDLSIEQSSRAGEYARNLAAEKFSYDKKMHLVFVKSAIPEKQLASTTAINLVNYCEDYYGNMEDYTVDIVDTPEDAIKLIAKDKTWDKSNTIVGLIDKDSLNAMTKALTDNEMKDRTKLISMEKFDEGQFVPIKGFFDLMATLVRINRALDKPEDRELLDAIRGLLNGIGVKDVSRLIDALAVADYFEDPIKFATRFIIKLLPPARSVDAAELRNRYNAARKVVEAL